MKSVEGGKISDRLEEIKRNSEKWKNRVGELNLNVELRFEMQPKIDLKLELT